MSISVKSGSTGDLADVNTNKELKVALNASAASAGYALVANSGGQSFSVGDHERVRVSTDYIMFNDPIQGASPNFNMWTLSSSTMSSTAANGALTLNSGSTTTASTYFIFTSSRYLPQLVEYPLCLTIKAKVIFPANNSVIELGMGNAATTATPTDGAFFRINSSGQLQGVQNNNGAETTTAAGPTLSTSSFYEFKIFVYQNQVEFKIYQPAAGPNTFGTIIWDTQIAVPTTQGCVTGINKLPVFLRVYNTGSTPLSAPQLVVSSVNASQLDIMQIKPWGHKVAGMGRHAVQNPVSTFSQLAGWANTSNVSSITPNNTATTAYTTLGGQFIFVAPATSATDVAIFAYTVPTGYQLYITGIGISCANTGVAVATTATILQWAAGVNASAISLATADNSASTFQPRRFALGQTSFLVAAGIGTQAPEINRSFHTPLVCESGRVVHILIKPLLGTATASQTMSGVVSIEGYFE